MQPEIFRPRSGMHEFPARWSCRIIFYPGIDVGIGAGILAFRTKERRAEAWPETIVN